MTFEPSNGLGPAFADAPNEPDIVLPFGTRIDTDTGLVQDADGNPIAVKTTQLAQSGVAPIRVLEARSFEISSVTITGTAAIAFVAPGLIKITDRLTARAVRATNAPGARISGACLGNDVNQFDCMCNPDCSIGAGGGGNAQVGGRGGASSQASGGVLTGFTPLAGGCPGGFQRSDTGTNVIAHGGGGGGAIQIASGTQIEISGRGLIDVGGGGGESTAGGGSGGNVILEAPTVLISGALAGVVANGGAGGGCGMTGADATITTAPALGAKCPNYFAGDGGAGTTGPSGGCRIGLDSCTSVCPVIYGGGGGASGRMRIATRDGTFTAIGSPSMSVVITAVPLAPL